MIGTPPIKPEAVNMSDVNLTRRLGTSPETKTFCEFFAGIGLVREGLEASGWSCIYANDIDAKKQKAYEARFGKGEHFHLGDIADTQGVLERITEKPILATASFPCVDLSLAGHYRGFEGKQSSTFFGFAEVLEAMGADRPAIVLLENVPGFLTSRKGEDFALVARRLAGLGYWLDAFVLDACHFTPQSRQRVFVIGVIPSLVPDDLTQQGTLWPVERPSELRTPTIMRFKRTLNLPTGWMALPLPEAPTRQNSLSDMIDIGLEQAWWAEDEVRRHSAMMSDLHRRKVNEILISKRQWVGTIFRRIREHTMRAEVRFDGLAGCLRTPRGGSAKQIVITADGGKLRMRWMSPCEYARLQGTPNFPLVGTTTQQLWGFADAVCVPAIRWIDQHLLSPLCEAVTLTACHR